MTKLEKTECKRFAKNGMATIGIKIPMKNIALLEMASGYKEGALHFAGNKEFYISYVMFEDRKTGRQFQISYSSKNYTDDNKSLFYVREYEA